MEETMIITEQSYEEFIRQNRYFDDMELKVKGLVGISLGIENGSLREAVEYLEKEAERFGATHIFNVHYKTLDKSENPFRPLGHYEAIGDAYALKDSKERRLGINFTQ